MVALSLSEEMKQATEQIQEKTFTVKSHERDDDRSIRAEVKVDHSNKLITMYGKEHVKESRDIYMRFLSCLVARNSLSGANYNILLK